MRFEHMNQIPRLGDLVEFKGFSCATGGHIEHGTIVKVEGRRVGALFTFEEQNGPGARYLVSVYRERTIPFPIPEDLPPWVAGDPFLNDPALRAQAWAGWRE